MNSQQILDREFLEIRAKVLEVAAALDRIERAEGEVTQDPRAELLVKAIEIINGSGANATRAERVQILFSNDYDSNWQDNYQIKSRGQ